MSSKLQWGILSTARITEALVFAIKSSSRSDLVAVASRDEGRAKSFADKNGIPTFFGNYDDLLGDVRINVVYVPLPNSMHFEWALKAARAGKHVLVEKPIVTQLKHLDALEKAAGESHVVMFEALMSLHAPQNRQVREMVSNGRIGRLRLINSWFGYYLPPEERGDIRLDLRLDGGSYWDIGVYPNSFVISMTGGKAPERVWAAREIGETGVDVMLSAQMSFAGGTVAQIFSGLRTPFVEGALLVGSEGLIRLPKAWIPGMNGRSDNGPDSTIELTERDGNTKHIAVAASNPWQAEVAAMEACVIDGAKPIVPLTLSREFLKSSLALLESARTGRPLNVR